MDRSDQLSRAERHYQNHRPALAPIHFDLNVCPCSPRPCEGSERPLRENHCQGCGEYFAGSYAPPGAKERAS